MQAADNSFNEYLAQGAALLRRAADDAALGKAAAAAADLISAALGARLPLLVCGNGGSASDAMHIAGELVGRFKLERAACNVLALSANPAVLTAWSNDYDFASVFARQVEAHGQAGGVLWAISTSGNSPNVLAALVRARAMGMATIGLSGAGGGAMAPLCDVLLAVPSSDTPRIQEMHVFTYHHICATVEQRLASQDPTRRMA